MKFHDDEITLIIRTFEQLESQNDHGAAALYLARVFKNKAAAFILERINAIHTKTGSIDRDLIKYRNRIAKPLYAEYKKLKKN